MDEDGQGTRHDRPTDRDREIGVREWGSSGRCGRGRSLGIILAPVLLPHIGPLSIQPFELVPQK